MRTAGTAQLIVSGSEQHVPEIALLYGLSDTDRIWWESGKDRPGVYEKPVSGSSKENTALCRRGMWQDGIHGECDVWCLSG